jgi:O-antigen ligase
MGSRAGVITILTGVMLLFISFLGNRRVIIFLGAVLLTLVLVLAGISKYMNDSFISSRIDKYSYYYQIIKNGSATNSPLTISNRVRWDYIRVAWAQITQNKNILFGSGPGTFGNIKIEELKFASPLLEYKKNWSRPSHAHNEYLNRLVEQGLLGIGMHIFFLIYLGICLFRSRSKTGRVYWQWVACLGFLNTAVVAGLFNTVLTNELAWQAMMLTGIFMQWANLSTSTSSI